MVLHDFSHFLSCRKLKGGGWITRHNLLVKLLAKYINLAGGCASVIPKPVDKNSGKVVDIDAILGGKHFLIDVRVTHPLAETNRFSARATLGAACDAEVNRKSAETV